MNREKRTGLVVAESEFQAHSVRAFKDTCMLAKLQH